MNPILQINQLKSDNKDQSVFKITISQGADQINTHEDLLRHLSNSIPVKKGIINIKQSTPESWIITSYK